MDVTGIEAKVQPGDVDCSGEVNSIDALFVLQFDAALIVSLPCPVAGDVNEDGMTNSGDAAVILQWIAGVVEVLSVEQGVIAMRD